MSDIIIENARLRLVVGSDCIAKSLVYKATGEECLLDGMQMPLFSVTQDRPFNNEIKQVYPCEHTTYPANRVRREGDQLIIGFSVAPYEAVVKVVEKDRYVAFFLDRFIVHPGDYGRQKMDTPPVAEFCLLQLPVKEREHFGDWLNVSWDEKVAVNVLATAPQTLVDADKRNGHRVMRAHVESGIRLQGPGAALIVEETDKLLDTIAIIEEDYDLPRGVESRRNPLINASIYYTCELNPQTVDKHIAYAKAGGFRMMQVYYTSIFEASGMYGFIGNYDYKDSYPNGRDDLIAVLNKVKAAGITPGLHVLQPHIGMKSRYVTPVADHRLNLKRHFTLAKPLDAGDTTIFVEQDTYNAPMADKTRVLQFGGELITYEGYTDEYPYCFTGCTRGAYGTVVQEHPAGQIGGVLDVSEFGGVSVYLDQNSSLSEEIAQKIADAYNCGFQFIYFDGAEGVQPPFAYHLPNAQYRVYKKLQPAPILCVGAAKSHFSWHMISGGNAFDVFGADVFKEKIAQFPAQAAPRARDSFTCVNFGWWQFWGTPTQADHFEYSTSRAAAWDCPATMISDERLFEQNPRLYDVLEVLRRWEEVRTTGWLTSAQKEELKNLEQEHILLINEQKDFELVPYNEIKNLPADISAFSFARKGENYAVYWHRTGNGKLHLPLDYKDIQVMEELYGEALPACDDIPVDKRRYIKSKLPMDKLIAAFQKAELKEG